jgi:cytosine/adenosine deaminase-related metal-dependent hydrolase
VEAGKHTLLRAQWVAPMDRPPVRDGAVVFAGETIADVGDAATLARAHRGADEHDLGLGVLIPGLINAHVHLELSDMSRVGGATPALADWLIEVIKRMPQGGEGDDADRVTRAVEAGVAQCLRFGVTTVADITRLPLLTRPALRRSQLRVVSFGEIQAMAGRRHLLGPRLAAASDRTHEGDRLRVGLSPHAPYSVEPAAYARCVHLSRGEHFPIATHLAESPDEATFLTSHSGAFRKLWDFLQAWTDDVPRFAGGPIRFAKSLGLLDVPALLAHVNYCDDDELKLLAGGRASVVYCPTDGARCSPQA